MLCETLAPSKQHVICWIELCNIRRAAEEYSHIIGCCHNPSAAPGLTLSSTSSPDYSRQAFIATLHFEPYNSERETEILVDGKHV